MSVPPTVPPTVPPANPPANPPGFTPITINSQEDFDRYLGDRLAQKDRSVRAEFADHDDLKAKAAELETLKRTSETEAERRVREAAEAAKTETTTTLKTQYEGEIGKLRNRLVREAIKNAAITAGFKYPDDVVTRLVGDDKAGIAIGDDYTITGVDKAVEKLGEERPEWLDGEGTFAGSPPGGRGSGNSKAEYDIEGIKADQTGRRHGVRVL